MPPSSSFSSPMDLHRKNSNGFLGMRRAEIMDGHRTSEVKDVSNSGSFRVGENEAKEDKKKGVKKIRSPKFAFQTRTEVDILDDGYRWRKYGQKAVKNNRFPRLVEFLYLV
ncbi:hypothetical protein RHMOL_Rhmol10G0006200 [Rhododendron molle]|uniref:Uncharacterized protein n=1 Tax=Rhododendron molle TaxID=49168 RepID=A0ACC0LXE5_RHOML|nr:hypothetical protein RHMOL_Rhmol10G0006200 [Rhododendron molle]